MINKRAKMLGSLIAAGQLLSPIFAVANDFYQSRGGWEIAGTEKSCVMMMEYEGPGDTNFALVKTSGNDVFVKITNTNWSAKEGVEYEVAFALDGKAFSGMAVGVSSYINNGFLAKMPDDFERHFAAGSSLGVYLDDQKIDQLSLSGTALGLASVNQCLAGVRREIATKDREVARWAHLPKDPFASAKAAIQNSPSDRDASRLDDALSRLSLNARDDSALVDAGNSAGNLGDTEGSVGYLRRAYDLAPNDPNRIIGLAKAMLLDGDALGALSFLDKAERAGVPATNLASDRGLVHDLLGDAAAAQSYYQVALNGQGDDVTMRRLAISQVIAGDAKGAESTLMPLLRTQDKPAWRTRAFALAIAGDTAQAVQVAQTVLPGILAESIAPYLRYMPRLTPAQQAAAANLGSFPRASEIGRDAPQIAAYAASKRPPSLPPVGQSRSNDIAAPLRASQAANQMSVLGRDEEFRKLFLGWVRFEAVGTP